MPRPFGARRLGAVTRRRFLLSLSAACWLPGAAFGAGFRAGGPWKPTTDVLPQVIPKEGIKTSVVFADSIEKLIVAGALDPDKLRSLNGDLPDWVERVLQGPSAEPIVFSRETAPYLVDLLWPLGLANKTAFNWKSPIATVSIPGLASTGGWTLGRDQKGYVYFNKIDAVPMTGQAEALALEVATNSFRPCCNNNTFFQDCNHGSALLGLIELAASQGATAEAIYRVALAANSFWFPKQYAKTALYFAHFEGRWWNDVAPQRILGADFSSLSGWRRNVDAPLRQADIDLPADPSTQPSCGI
jgi:hypothetical protein